MRVKLVTATITILFDYFIRFACNTYIYIRIAQCVVITMVMKLKIFVIEKLYAFLSTNHLRIMLEARSNASYEEEV